MTASRTASPSPAVRPVFGDLPLRYYARVTLTLKTALSLSTGHTPGSGAADVMRDANDLPAIPGSALAGILRHALEDWWITHRGKDPKAAAEAVATLFGDDVGTDDGQASRLWVTWGRIHDSGDRPVDGLLAPTDPRLTDPLLADARGDHRRDRVRLSHRGTVDGRGKFEERVVLPGHRFTFDLCLRGSEDTRADDETGWSALLALLHDPAVRLGGGSRRGRGAFAVTRLLGGMLDLRKADDRALHARLPVRLDQPFPRDWPTPLPHPPEARPTTARRSLTITLKGLRLVTPWLVGGGIPDGQEAMAPQRSHWVIWETDDQGQSRGRISDHPALLLPATALKGVLAHRLAWYGNLLEQKFAADAASPDNLDDWCGQNNPVVQTLIGMTSDTRETAEDARDTTAASSSRRGWLILDDGLLTDPPADPPQTQEVQHVSLDRFTGGARNGLLFSERVINPALLKTDLALTLVLPRTKDEAPPKDHLRLVQCALWETLQDVRRGHLALGNGTGRGNGRLCCDKVEWSDDGKWIAPPNEHSSSFTTTDQEAAQ